MKFANLALLLVVLLATVANLLLSLGFINSPSEYRAIGSTQMDKFGFKKLAENNGIVIHNDGEQPATVPDDGIRVSFTDENQKVVIDYPKEMANDLAKTNMLPFTINMLEKEGWSFVSVTSDDHYIFRKGN